MLDTEIEKELRKEWCDTCRYFNCNSYVGKNIRTVSSLEESFKLRPMMYFGEIQASFQARKALHTLIQEIREDDKAWISPYDVATELERIMKEAYGAVYERL